MMTHKWVWLVGVAGIWPVCPQSQFEKVGTYESVSLNRTYMMGSSHHFDHSHAYVECTV